MLTETTPAGVVTVTLHPPEVRNAFDDALIAELKAVVERIIGELLQSGPLVASVPIRLR